ncbi:MAG: glycine--tRNA ligase subunit beta [Brevundimonas sp. 12-68-7]|uniref:Glycine--tRNA ligase beta subunit n=1 Tax=Brevundimonas subvibrioides TaxID=74313 RepID=A0A258FRR2_9CAUL|nr:MAG: glycine--tRNA ligase subunit beta [Brevundimonas sp. 12-68-7]OYX35201.1 MAG: glycine--tRNA ligase subunit beta [Brevundimonas subvibrioides]
MPQLLIELFSEEIPARMQAGAARDLERMASERLKAAGLTWEALTTYAGPRRLTLVVEGLPAATPDRSEELKGPKASAPEQALDGFLRKTGLTRDQLSERDGVLYAVIEQKGRATADLIPEMVEGIIRNFPWPKSMRWGDGTLTWVRPLKRIVCLFDGKVVPFAVEGIQSGDVTEGHRFMGSGHPLTVRSFEDYRKQLEDNFVLLDQADRKVRIVEGARAVCHAQNLEMIDDDGLLEEVSGLAERPTPILGEMDPSFLDLPPEVIRLSMKTHQKYFAVAAPPSNPASQASVPPEGGQTDSVSPPSGGSTREAGEGGKSVRALAPHFVVVANVEATDGGRALAAGNSRVLSARLNDARFFWDEDRKVGFETWLKKLEGVTFHARLGTMAERVERIAALAREIAPLVGADPDQTETAARLAKGDLASGMVGEFPELQGIMGGYYARALDLPTLASLRSAVPPHEGEGESARDPLPPLHGEGPRGGAERGWGSVERDAIADAIRDHYKPQGPADTVPTAPLTVAVALADKLDTLVGFFAIDEKPTGSKDPFALRRAALGAIRIVLENNVRVSLDGLFDLARPGADPWGFAWPGLELHRFFVERLKVILRDSGARHDLVDAVVETMKDTEGLGDDDLVRIVRRVEALDAFLATDDGANLLAGYRRASNILKAEEKKGPLPVGAVATGQPNQPEAETALAFAAEAARGRVERALETEDFAAAMTALAGLRAPVDAFFTDVMVNSEVPAERENRLKLLGQVRAVMGRVADFGQVAG